MPTSYREKVIPPKPFLKWAGGKTQLLNSIALNLPEFIQHKKPFTYVEPFVGSGAVLFWMLRTFPNIKKAIINDVNTDLITAYQIIQSQVHELIAHLEGIEKEYLGYTLEMERKVYFLKQRIKFNERNNTPLKQTALLIFLNRTCFNGLYRVNRKNEFNVPFGRYKNPRICHKEVLLANHQALQKVEILQGDFEQTASFLETLTFFYFDPPYKPISTTSSFTAYAQAAFGDAEQHRLKRFCDTLHQQKCSWLLSNSDPKSVEDTNTFFDDLYQEYAIKRVDARRAINSKATKRGVVKELLISNY